MGTNARVVCDSGTMADANHIRSITPAGCDCTLRLRKTTSKGLQSSCNMWTTDVIELSGSKHSHRTVIEYVHVHVHVCTTVVMRKTVVAWLIVVAGP